MYCFDKSKKQMYLHQEVLDIITAELKLNPQLMRVLENKM